MTVYRVSYFNTDDDEHRGYSYFETRREAQDSINGTACKTEVERLSIPCTVDGVIKALNQYASHADNG